MSPENQLQPEHKVHTEKPEESGYQPSPMAKYRYQPVQPMVDLPEFPQKLIFIFELKPKDNETNGDVLARLHHNAVGIFGNLIYAGG